MGPRRQILHAAGVLRQAYLTQDVPTLWLDGTNVQSTRDRRATPRPLQKSMREERMRNSHQDQLKYIVVVLLGAIATVAIGGAVALAFVPPLFYAVARLIIVMRER